MRYALLLNPGFNRVYFGAARDIMRKEFEIVTSKRNFTDIEFMELAGVAYLGFRAEGPADAAALAEIAGLSFFLALFELHGGKLLPVYADAGYAFPENINTILKYTGKTNERFVRLMVNAAMALAPSVASGAAMALAGRKLRLLDPVAGRGTVLFEGIARGMDAVGIEIEKNASEANVFFEKYLQEGRYKHKFRQEKRADKQGRKAADAVHAEFASNKEDFDRKVRQNYSLYTGDCAVCLDFIKNGSIDIIAADLPYGVQHKSAGKTRNAVPLVESVADKLFAVLARGGALVFAFNEFTTKKAELADVVRGAGFEVLTEYPFDDFTHRVDQAIKRDLIVARKG